MTTTTQTPIFVVVEYDEDNIATAWRTAFRTVQDAASAIEAHHAQEWIDADMPGEPAELVILSDGEGGISLSIVRLPPWLAWTVTPVTIA